MRVLVACEESQEVTKAFIYLGHDAMSCDLYPGAKGLPHYQGDVMDVINDGWDLMIAHPPCTYLSNAGARHLYPKGILNQDRYEKGLQAKTFFMALYNANIPAICVENPTPSTIFNLPKYNQVIQPYQFGHPYQKRTCLWLKGLPPLAHTGVVSERESTKVPGNWYNTGGKDRQKMRARTFEGIAAAMAFQWSYFLSFPIEKRILVLSALPVVTDTPPTEETK